MAKRMIVMLVLMTAFVGVLGVVKVRQFQAMGAQFAAMQPPPEAVTTIVAEQEEWPATLSAIGTVAAVQGVTVSADLPASSIASRSIPERPSSRGRSSRFSTRVRNRRSSRRPRRSYSLRG